MFSGVGRIVCLVGQLMHHKMNQSGTHVLVSTANRLNQISPPWSDRPSNPFMSLEGE